MRAPIEAYDLGRVPYRSALAFQRRAVETRAAGRSPDVLYFVEHDPVVTVGRAAQVLPVGDSAAGSAAGSSFRIPAAELRRRGIDVVPVERGGDVTYHGPGQVVGYPIVALDGIPSGRDLHKYLRSLEEAVLRVLAGYGLDAARRPPYTGVWVGDRKVAAIGVAVRRWVAFHGFALNVEPDLAHFDLIHPCGIRHLGVASLATLLGKAPSRPEVIARLARAFEEIWERPVVLATEDRAHVTLV